MSEVSSTEFLQKQLDDLVRFFQKQLDDLTRLLDERYSTQTKAVDAAFAAAERAVVTALLSAKEAVEKAEVAADRRFELLNELRGDVATKTQFEELDKRVVANTIRIEKAESAQDSAGDYRSERRLDTARIVGIYGLGLVIISICITALIAVLT